MRLIVVQMNAFCLQNLPYFWNKNPFSMSEYEKKLEMAKKIKERLNFPISAYLHRFSINGPHHYNTSPPCFTKKPSGN